MEFVAQGDEGKIYRYRNFIFKLYDDKFPFEKMQREYNFLKKYQSSGAVPKVYSTMNDLRELGIIVMEDLKGYVTLYEIGCNKKKKKYSKAQLSALLKALITTRYKIGYDQEYTDLHYKNVMVKITDDKVDVRFIDPGDIVDHDGAHVWIDWVIERIYEFNLSQYPIAKIIITRNLNNIVKLLEN